MKLSRLIRHQSWYILDYIEFKALDVRQANIVFLCCSTKDHVYTYIQYNVYEALFFQAREVPYMFVFHFAKLGASLEF